MANSGIEWVDVIFNWAVYALVYLAQLLGISYEGINIWLFSVQLSHEILERRTP